MSETVKQVVSVVKKHRGRIYMDALVKDDTWAMQVLKVDVLHYLTSSSEDDLSPVYTSRADNDDLYLHRS